MEVLTHAAACPFVIFFNKRTCVPNPLCHSGTLRLRGGADDEDQVMDLVQMATNYRRYARTPRAMKTKRILQEVVVLVETAVENGLYTLPVARDWLMARLIEEGTDEEIATQVADQIQLPNVLARGLADRGVRCLASWETVRRKGGYTDKQCKWKGQPHRPCSRCGLLTSCWCDGCEDGRVSSNGRRGRSLCYFCERVHRLCVKCESAGVILFDPGSTVRLCHLQARPSLNGTEVRVHAYNDERGRYEVELPGGEMILVRQPNLERFDLQTARLGTVRMEWVSAVMERTCAACGVGECDRKLWRCDGCSPKTAPWYCSEKCQRDDWDNGHRQCCGLESP